MKKIVFVVFYLCCFTYCFSQDEASNWYFGFGAGIRFDQINGTVSSVNNGQLNTFEGCTSISDADGNLLFYTDGITVFNRNNTVMQNGTNLFGDSSSTQSALIVPKPDDPNIYYIFTVDVQFQNEPVHHGFNYSVVDMTLAGGLGAVTTEKNIKLLDLTSEKITAVLKDCITKSIWVVTFASEDGTQPVFNTYHAFEVNSLGVSNTSIKSVFNLNITDQRGYLKLSPDGSKMVCANMRGNYNDPSNTDQLLIFDFDENTGKASNMQRLSISSQNIYPYGVEFSPDSQLLYVNSSNDASANNPSSDHTASLTQFNLASPNIQASEFRVDERQLYRGGLQLGPDGKIYRALSASYNQGLPYLAVINQPNIIGSGCNYQHIGVNLSPNYSSQGLPPFIQSLFNTEIDIIRNGKSATNLALCDGDTYTLLADDFPGATYSWSFNGLPLADDNFDLEVTQSGHYELYIDPNNGDCAIEGQAYVIYNKIPESFNANIIQCDEDGIKDGITIFNINQVFDDITGGKIDRSISYYLDQNGLTEIDGNSYRNILNPQIIYAKVTNTLTGCFSVSQVTLEVSLTNSKDAVLEVCDDDGNEDGYHVFNLSDADSQVLAGTLPGLDLVYYETYNDALLEQNPLSNTFTNSNAYSQTIYARVENDNACYGISEVQLTVNQLPNIEIEFETLYCLNSFPQTITLTGGVIGDSTNNYSYNWSTGETTPEIEINETGIYRVLVTNSIGCSKERKITVLPSNVATFTSIDVTDASENNSIVVHVTGEGDYEFTIDNVNGHYQEENTFEDVRPGFHTVYVRDKNNCGIVDKLVSVIGFPKYFTPNHDGYNDTWQVYGISAQFQPNTVIYIFDRFGKLLKQLDPKGPGWDGTFNGDPLPTSDYWFAVTLEDGRVFKSHFTLKQ